MGVDFRISDICWVSGNRYFKAVYSMDCTYSCSCVAYVYYHALFGSVVCTCVLVCVEQ